jgi:hypothetical protein
MLIQTEIILHVFPLLCCVAPYQPVEPRETSHPNSRKRFRHSRERFVHTAVHIIDNPKKALAHAAGQLFKGPDRVATKGVTFVRPENRRHA